MCIQPGSAISPTGAYDTKNILMPSTPQGHGRCRPLPPSGTAGAAGTKQAGLIPVFSYIFLGGKCKNCKQKISWFYPIFEFLSGILFIIASVTDFIDGKIARKYNLITDTGKILDAIADWLNHCQDIVLHNEAACPAALLLASSTIPLLYCICNFLKYA